MRILTFESTDKKQQRIEEISYEAALRGLIEDRGWIEVIDAYNQENLVRAYFDIDGGGADVLRSVLSELNHIFGCTDADWAICDGSRDGKVSYHILSRLYSITLRSLRSITFALHGKFRAVDYTLLCISAAATNELLFFRLPNQSKGTLNKSGTPMKVLQGELADFIVTHVAGLAEFKLPAATAS